MFCPACGAQCPDIASFCTQCGFKLPRIDVPPTRTGVPSPSPSTAEPSDSGASFGTSRQYRIQQKPKSGMVSDYDVYDEDGRILLRVDQNKVTALQVAAHIATLGDAKSGQKRSYLCRDASGKVRFSFEMRPSGRITVTRLDSSLIARVRPLSGFLRSYEVLGPSDQHIATVKTRLADNEDHWFRITDAHQSLLGYLDHFSNSGVVKGIFNGAKDVMTLGLAKDIDEPYCILTLETDISDDLLSSLIAIAVHYDHSWE